MQTTLADLPQTFSLMKLGLDLEKKLSTGRDSLCEIWYYALSSKRFSVNAVVKEIKETAEINRNAIVRSIGEDLTKRIECFKFS